MISSIDQPDSKSTYPSSSSIRAVNSGLISSSFLAILRCWEPKPEYTNTGPAGDGESAATDPIEVLPAATWRSRLTASATLSAVTTARLRPWLRPARERATGTRSASARPSKKSARLAAAFARRDGSSPETGSATAAGLSGSISCDGVAWGACSPSSR